MIHLEDTVKAWTALQSHIHIKPISSEDDYLKMVALANELADNLEPVHGPVDEMFHLVTELIGVWEAQHVRIPQAEPKEVLRYLLEVHHLRRKDLADIVSRSQISDILSGRRAISKRLAKDLATRFNTDVSVFICGHCK